jgi:hypothetical protein
VPAGWQTVRVGGAEFAVPEDWTVVDTRQQNAAECFLYYSTPPMVVVGPTPAPPIPCPAPDRRQPGPGIRAATDVEWGLRSFGPGGSEVFVNGLRAEFWEQTETSTVGGDEVVREFAVYRFDEVDLWLRMRVDSAPELMAEIFGTVRRAELGDGPSEPAGIPSDWQRVLAGGGQFFVPSDWVVDSPSRIDEACELYFSTPPLVLVGPLGRIPSCPMDDDTNPGPGIRAGGLDLVEWFFPDSPGEPVVVAGFAAERWVFEDEYHRLESFRIDELDLFLRMRTDSAPELMEQILASVGHVASGPVLMEAQPNPARPGDVVDLTFPLETGRGVAFMLEEWTGEEYVRRYYLISVPAGMGSAPTWFDVDDNVGWEDIGIGGPGPDQVVIPEVARPGRYRICIANAGEDFCAPIEIVGA